MQDENLPISLHENAFTSVIASQGTDEQQAYWLPKCQSYEVVGCYAQTELAHGSNVQGLETKARYDKEKDEFVIFSPRMESTKWWIGGMGVMANHALVQAILELPGNNGGWESKGPHLFIVPIRSSPGHRELPGVTVGDIGPKAYTGFRFMDNGYLHLEDVRIPRKNMLSRFARLSEKGEYTPAKHAKLSYGSMVALRAGIPINMGWTLARATTIAIRYCLHRKQFRTAASGKEEQQVLLYASTAHRLYPLLATSYAYIFAGQQLMGLYQQMMAKLKKGDPSLLPETHALSVALKVASTWACVPGLEEARKSMGGHGYSHMSGAGALFAHNTPAQTFEGDNYVISQQIARALQKAHIAAKNFISVELPSSMAYIGGKETPRPDTNLSDPALHLWLLQNRARYLVSTLPEEGDISWQSAAIAKAHSDVYSIKAFAARRGVHPLLAKIYTQFALDTLLNAVPELFEAGLMGVQDVRELKKRQRESVANWTVGDAVAGTDAFGFVEWELPGVLGGEKEVYGEMWKTVRETDVGRGEKGEELRKAARDIVGHEQSRGKL